MSDHLITIGRLMGPFGIKGEMRILLDGELTAENLIKDKIPCIVQKNNATLTLTKVRNAPKGLAGIFSEIPDRNVAETYPKSALMVDEKYLPELPEDEFFLDDMVGFRVYNQLREDLAEVISVHNFGAGDVFEVKFQDGKEVMIPDTPDLILEISYDQKVITVSEQIKKYHTL